MTVNERETTPPLLSSRGGVVVPSLEQLYFTLFKHTSIDFLNWQQNVFVAEMTVKIFL